MPGIGQDKTLAVGDQVGSGFSLSQSDFPFQSPPFTLQEGNNVSLHEEFWDFQLALGRAPQSVFGFPHPAEELIVEGQLQIPNRKVRIDLDLLSRGVDPLLVFTRSG